MEQNEPFDHDLPSKIIKSMLSQKDLVHLREMSKTFYDWVGHSAQERARVFKTLYVTSILKKGKREARLATLHSIGSFCEHLVIVLKHGTKEPGILFEELPEEEVKANSKDDDSKEQGTVPGEANIHSGPLPALSVRRERSSTVIAPAAVKTALREAKLGTSAPSKLIWEGPRSDWDAIFKEIRNIHTITLSVRGERPNDHLTHFEAAILSVRHAIEKAKLLSFHEVRLAPFHPLGLTFCRWEGSALINTPQFIFGWIWSRITVLEVQVRYPYDGSMPSTERNFDKIVHLWLASFASRLRVLKFNWIDSTDTAGKSNAPNPLLIDRKYMRKEFSSKPIEWAHLEEFWLAGMGTNLGRLGDDVVDLISKRALHLQKFNVLHDPTRCDDADIRKDNIDTGEADADFHMDNIKTIHGYAGMRKDSLDTRTADANFHLDNINTIHGYAGMNKDDAKNMIDFEDARIWKTLIPRSSKVTRFVTTFSPNTKQKDVRLVLSSSFDTEPDDNISEPSPSIPITSPHKGVSFGQEEELERILKAERFRTDEKDIKKYDEEHGPEPDDEVGVFMMDD